MKSIDALHKTVT